MISERLQRAKYVLGDFVTSNVAWLCYNCLRYNLGMVHGYESSTLGVFLSSRMIVLGQIFFPLMMMLIYYFSGYYNEVFRKSRLSELITTLCSTLVNVILIMLAALLNDMSNIRAANYESLLLLFALLFFFTYLVRALITNHASRLIKGRRWRFPTLVVGDGSAAVAFVRKLEAMRRSLGFDVVGYVHIPGENPVKEIGKPVYQLDEVAQACADLGAKELLVVPTKHNSGTVLKTINRLFSLDLPIKMTPDKYNIILSRSRWNDIYGDPLIDVSGSSMSDCEKNVKRAIDVVVSALALLVLLPVFLIVAVAIKCDSRGSVFYAQERVGRHNRPFRIIKFRTMVQNAESGVPQLSREGDPRITRLGRFMRKYRIDELPQFWNVLKGDMSIVGPRPERQYYVDQIVRRAPAYSLVHQVRPGITSMGMVKYGYATTLQGMIERMNYDLLYLDNMSLINDLKIVVYTVKIVFTGRGM